MKTIKGYTDFINENIIINELEQSVSEKLENDAITAGDLLTYTWGSAPGETVDVKVLGVEGEYVSLEVVACATNQYKVGNTLKVGKDDVISRCTKTVAPTTVVAPQ